MKRIIILLLLLTLLCACGQEATPDTPTTKPTTTMKMPELEQMSTLPRQECTAELNFVEALPVGAVVELLDGDTVVASYTVEATTYMVRLSSDAVNPDVSYSLKVNGVLQQHSGMSMGRPGAMTPPPGEIPDPSQPPISEAPMNTEPTGDSNGFTPGNSSSMGGFAPPQDFSVGEMPPEGEGFPGDISIEELPSGGFLNGQLPPEPPVFSGSLEVPDAPISSGGQIPGKEPEQLDPTAFRLVGGQTAFYGVCPAN